MLLAAGTMGLTQVFLRKADFQGDEAAYQLSAFKYALTIIGISVFFLWLRKPPRLPERSEWLPLAAFGFSDAAATILLFIGSLRLPLAINSVLSDLHVLITPLLLAAMRVEKVTGLQYISVAMGMLGAALITGADTTSGGLSWAMTVPLAAAALWCISALAARKITHLPKTYPQLSVAIAGVITAIISLAVQDPTLKLTPGDAGMFTIGVTLAIVSQVCFVLSMTSGDIVAALAGIPAYAFFGAVFGYTFFGEALTRNQVLGALTLLIGLLIFTYEKEIGTRKLPYS